MAKNEGQKMKTRSPIFCHPSFAKNQYSDTTRSPNQPAAGNAGFAPRFQIGHPWPGVPESGRSL
jgi:hypothetical protein